MIPHVIPIADEQEHELSGNCWCQPMLRGGVWIHNSMDMREVYEQVVGESYKGRIWGVFNEPDASAKDYTKGEG